MLFPRILGVWFSRAALATCFPSFPSFPFQKLGFRAMALIELFMGSIAWTKFIEKISKTVAFSDYGVDRSVNFRRHRLEWARAVFKGVSVGLTFQRQQDGRLGHFLRFQGLVLLHASFANVAATIRGKQAVASTYTCTFVSKLIFLWHPDVR